MAKKYLVWITVVVLVLFFAAQNNRIKLLEEKISVVAKQSQPEEKPVQNDERTEREKALLDHLIGSLEPARFSAGSIPNTFYENDLKFNVPDSSNPNSGSFIGLAPGQGFFAQDHLVALRRSAPFPAAIEKAKNIPTPGNVIKTKIESVTDVSEEYEARMLYTAFSAKLSGFGAKVDLSASREQARKELSQNTIVYITMSTTGNDSVAVDDGLCRWNDPEVEKVLSKIELLDDDNERRYQFVTLYGTHYVKTVERGAMIVIRASMANKEKSVADEFKLAMSASGWGQRTNAEIAQEFERVVKKYNCTIEIQTMAEIEPREAFLFGADIGKVFDTLDKIQSKDIKIREVPISLTLASYASTFIGNEKYPNIQRMFKKSEFLPMAESTYLNVPVGTVLPFAGSGTDIPQGYRLCNGDFVDAREYPRLFKVIGKTYGGDASRPNEFRLPDYRGYFLRGADLGSGHDPDFSKRQSLGDGNAGDVGSIQESAIKAHTHETETFSRRGWPDGSGDQTKGGDPFYFKDQSKAGGGPNQVTMLGIKPAGEFESRPVNVSINYIIKY
ncbi:hypothetical protein FACS1894187_07920 [Synergistales bacterium]|nr:hypothetical protein FACS1894187_07920 [Synergistales bacterium]